MWSGQIRTAQGTARSYASGVAWRAISGRTRQQTVPARLCRVVRRAGHIDRRARLVGDRFVLPGQLEELAGRCRATPLIGHPLLGRDVRAKAARLGPL